MIESTSNFQLFTKFSPIEGVGSRSRITNEIVPVSATQSDILVNDEANYGAMVALDLNLGTPAHTTSDGPFWWKANLGQLHCVYQVIDYLSNGNQRRSWTCLENGCVCNINDCELGSATVIIEEATSDLASISDCKYGDNVKIANPTQLYLYEVAITAKPGN